MPVSTLPKAFEFNNGFFATAGTFNLTPRTFATVGTDGVAVVVGAARYLHYPHVLCGAPDERVDIPVNGATVGSYFVPVAGGVAGDGVKPLIVVHSADAAVLFVYGYNSNGSVNLSAPVHALAMNCVMGGPASMNGCGDTRIANDFSVVLCHGLLMAFCQVQLGENSLNWKPVKSAVAWLDLSLANPTWNFINTESENQSGKFRGSYFQSAGYRVLPSGLNGSDDVTEAWFPFANYVNNSRVSAYGATAYSDTARYYLVRATRSAPEQPWSLGAMQLIHETPTRIILAENSTEGQHSHPPYLERFGALGLRLICPVGDSNSHNRVLAMTRSNKSYDQPGWTLSDDLHGKHVTSNPPSTSQMGSGNQFVGSAPLGTPAAPLGHAIGADEMTVPICRLVAPTNTTDRYNFTRLAGGPTSSFIRTSPTSAVNHVWNTFFIAKDKMEAAGPFAAHVAPGSQFSGTDGGWQLTANAVRVWYSPDGIDWGQCWSPNTVAAGTPVVMANGRIYFGSVSQNDGVYQGIRSVRYPNTVSFRPLVLGGGGTNLLQSVSVAASEDGNTVTVENVSLLVDKPPCLGPVYRCDITESALSNSRVGIWRLTADGAINPVVGSGGSPLVKVRAWVYVLPWSGSTVTPQPHANNLQLKAALGTFVAGSGSVTPDSFATSREEVQLGAIQTVGDARGWIPITFDTDTSTWIDQTNVNNPNAPTAPFALGLRLASVGGIIINPCSFYIAFECVTHGVATYPGVPLPPASGAPVALIGERAKYAGLSCGTNWSVRLAGMLGESGADQLLPAAHHGLASKPPVLCTLYQDAGKHLRIRVNIPLHRLEVWVAGASAAAITLAPPAALPERKFYFLRSSPILLAMTRSGSVYTLHASVGGTNVVSASATLPAIDVRPTEIRFGDENMDNTIGMEWFGGRVDEDAALTAAEAITSLQDLDFFAT